MVVEAEEPVPVLLLVTVVVEVLFVVEVTPEFVLVLILPVLDPTEVFELLEEDKFVPAEAVFTDICAEFTVGEAAVFIALAVGIFEIELLELLVELL
jgi:hypothetical protein